jgi:poly(A) polymerase
MAVIQRELEKGAQVTEEIMLGRRPWKDLFTKHNFFTSGFRYYLTVISSSRTKEAQNAWSGFIESRVRLLVNKIEMHPSIALARPFNKGYDRVHRCKNDAELDEVVSAGSLAYLYKPPADGDETVKKEVKQDIKKEDGVPVKQEDSGVKAEDGMRIKREHSEEVQPQATTNIKPEPGADETEVKLEEIPEKKDEAEEEMVIYTTNHYIGLQLDAEAKSLDLSREVNDWKAMCTSNDIYKAGTMFLSIQHVKNTALPDDVFEPGEVRPRPPKRSLKRVASEEPSKQQQPPSKRQAHVQGTAPAAQQPIKTATAAAG